MGTTDALSMLLFGWCEFVGGYVFVGFGCGGLVAVVTWRVVLNHIGDGFWISECVVGVGVWVAVDFDDIVYAQGGGSEIGIAALYWVFHVVVLKLDGGIGAEVNLDEVVVLVVEGEDEGGLGSRRWQGEHHVGETFGEDEAECGAHKGDVVGVEVVGVDFGCEGGDFLVLVIDFKGHCGLVADDKGVFVKFAPHIFIFGIVVAVLLTF